MFSALTQGLFSIVYVKISIRPYAYKNKKVWHTCQWDNATPETNDILSVLSYIKMVIPATVKPYNRAVFFFALLDEGILSHTISERGLTSNAIGTLIKAQLSEGSRSVDGLLQDNFSVPIQHTSFFSGNQNFLSLHPLQNIHIWLISNLSLT